ncbi:hypothetical protein PUNSTDRAFT_49442 [Punctularia strigosozonata HHB-11173 SS5]|uniref:uncharacterized protein n=1 Tax=Punctularia strigosozonata (strain HHB-11173) TaxID=741275 RepID=UPI0004417DFA|nr:uncharacterized protein PUNSTDRAFT_49442 [Punctularia strigosozonata HHB-11173 SS5]EIN12134.1 hypothetical protein PUNSTDRAFT_49442 [Punctularia strigosozonata HHB-11173 SS5]
MAVDPQSFDYTLRPPVPDLPRRRYPLLGKIALPQNARIVLHNDELSPYPVRLVDIRNFFRDDEPVKTVRSLRLVNIRTRDAFGGDLRFIRTMVESMPNISELAFVSCDEVNEFKQLSQGIVLLVYLHLEDLHRRSEGVPRPRAQAWPLLSTLTIHGTNISPQWLRQFLDIRAEIECPMRVLRLSAATVGNWREWELELLRKVVTVEVLDDSEGGFDGI